MMLLVDIDQDTGPHRKPYFAVAQIHSDPDSHIEVELRQRFALGGSLLLVERVVKFADHREPVVEEYAGVNKPFANLVD